MLVINIYPWWYCR